MSSFYGGKEGRTYNIVQRYDSVKDMVEAFSQGGAYTDANYGQYVIIDTIMNLNRKSDLENGLLYRRGFDYNDVPTDTEHVKPNIQNSKYYDVNHNFLESAWQQDWAKWVNDPGGGAIYVGQIVGPQGDSPEVILTSWDGIRESIPEGVKLDQTTHKIIPTSRTKGNNTAEITDDEGKTIWKGDAVKVASVTMKDTNDNIIGARLAFDIPEEIFVISAQSVDAYGENVRQHLDNITGKPEPDIDSVQIVATRDENTGQWKYTNLIHEHSKSGSNAGHPFYHNLDIAIPKGIHGRDIKEFTKETVEQINQDVDDPIVIDNKNVFSGDQYITYTTKDYQKHADGDLTEHLGRWPYRVIKQINLLNSIRNIITWEENKDVKIGDLYRTNTYTEGMYWVCIKSGRIESGDNLPDIIIENPDTQIPDTENSNNTIDEIGKIKELQNTEWRAIKIPEETPAHSLFVDYTAGADKTFENALRNVDHLSVDKEGNLYVFYSDNLSQPYYLTNIGGLKTGNKEGDLGVVLTDKSIQFHFTNDTTLTYPLKQILSIDFKTKEPLKDPDNAEEWWIGEDGKPVFDVKVDEEGKEIVDENGKKIPIPFDEIPEDSWLKIRYTNGDKEQYEVKRIKSINYDNEKLTNKQNILVEYEGDEEGKKVNNSPIDMVRAIQKKGDNVYVLYSNPATREAIARNKEEEGKKWIKLNWTDPVTGEIYDGQPGNNEKLVWKNFSSLEDGQAQYHVYGEVTYNDLKTWLAQGFRDFEQDPEYSSHEDLSGKAGWLVTVTTTKIDETTGAQIIDERRIYAYDYNGTNNHKLPDGTSTNWYEVFSLSASQIDPELSVIIDTQKQEQDEQHNKFYVPSEHSEPLLPNMLWFVESYGHDNY